MKTKTNNVKNVVKGTIAGLVLALSSTIGGCNYEAFNNHRNGVFNGHPVEVGVKDGRRYIKVAETCGTRTQTSPYIMAIDTDKEKFGFESIDINRGANRYEDTYSMNPTKTVPSDNTFEDQLNSLKKMSDPIELERIAAYVDAERLWER